MKKVMSLVILSAMLVLMLGAVSALSVAPTTTVIAGKIYNSDYTATESGATVEVTCGGNVLSTTSLGDGSYKVEYNGSTGYTCTFGNTLLVYAEKGTLSGYGGGNSDPTTIVSGTCTNPDTETCLINVISNVDVAVVNVPLVPEFGALVGALTILGAVGVFFVVRRK
jgi:hypothetical protein